MQIAAEREGAAVFSVRALGGGDACGFSAAESDVLGAGDADYVVAAVVERVWVFDGLIERVAQNLDDAFGGVVLPIGQGAEAGAAAVYSKGCGDGE